MTDINTATRDRSTPRRDRLDREMLQELFAEHGLRCTRQRIAIYNALRGTTAHPTIDELYQQVSESLPGLSLATVYNTVEAFCQVGLAQRLPGGKPEGNGVSGRYDATVQNHVHLRDRETGHVADAPETISQTLLSHIPDDLLGQLERETGFRVEDVQIEIVGSRPKRTTHRTSR